MQQQGSKQIVQNLVVTTLQMATNERDTKKRQMNSGHFMSELNKTDNMQMLPF